MGVPKNPIKYQEWKNKISSSLLGHIPWNKNKKGLQVAWNKNTKGLYTFKMPEEAKKKIALAQIGNKNGLGKRSEATCQRISDGKKNKKQTEAHKKALSKSKIEKIAKEPAYKEQLIDRLEKAGTIYQDTSIELKMKKMLGELNIRFIHPYRIPGILIADFFIPVNNLVIECDGDYWHNYPKGNDKDKLKNNLLINNGYKIIRFWEREINKNPLLVQNRILQVLSE